MAKTKAKTRSYVLPALDDTMLAEAGSLAFWKRVLPEGEGIDYTDKDGTTRRLEFTEHSNAELLRNFAERDQTPLMLADTDNRHTMDPERYRGDATDLRRHTDLPADVSAAVAAENEGDVPPGLYARVEFPTKKAARSVLNNPKLGVSARIREATGKRGAQIIHLLGTLDPKVRGLGKWTPALDFSEYASDELVDLTDKSYSEVPVAKKPKRHGGTAVIDLSSVPAIADVTDDDIDEMTDAELDAFLAVYGPGGTNDVSAHTDPEDEDDDDDTDEGEPGVKLSEKAQRQIDLANTAAESARKDGREALRRAADIEWKAERKSLLRDGVPPHVLDLAEDVLARPYDLVVDLSESDDEDINVAEVVRKLVEGYKGTVDLSEREIGHGGEGGADPEADNRARFNRDFPDDL